MTVFEPDNEYDTHIFLLFWKICIKQVPRNNDKDHDFKNNFKINCEIDIGEIKFQDWHQHEEDSKASNFQRYSKFKHEQFWCFKPSLGGIVSEKFHILSK